MANILQYTQDVYDYLNQYSTPYSENEVPANNQDLNNNLKVNFPYCTYYLATEDYRNTGLLQVRFYDKSDSYRKVTETVAKLEDDLGDGRIFNNIVLHKGSPFIQRVSQEDTTIKCLFINLEIDYI